MLTAHRVSILVFATLALGLHGDAQTPPTALRPVSATAPVANDADDPAIWVNRADPSQTLILGTNKVAAPDGALYVFGLDGQPRQVVKPIDRPNNVDVEYGLRTPGGAIDIAIVTERLQGRLRVFRVGAGGVEAIDGGGIPVLAGQTGEAAMPMGISIYRRPADGAIFAVVSPKTGGTENYLWQYRLTFDAQTGLVRGDFVRRFGAFSGTGEIEAVVVDDEAGFVYYADEEFALRQWHADPDHRDAGRELAVFARDGFMMQREGLAIVTRPDGSGFIVCSDQIPGATQLRIYQRQGPPGRPYEHPFVAALTTETDSTDGLDLTGARVSDRLPGGLLVMMNSAGKNFQLYDLRDVLRLAAGPEGPAYDSSRVGRAPALDHAGGVMRSSPPMYGRNAAGIVTDPSRSW